MKILVTGANGFVGSNLCESLKNIRDGKDRRDRYQLLLPLTVWEYDRHSCTPDNLEAWCADADFVFNFAGVNRPKKSEEFVGGNCRFLSTLIALLEKHNNTCPVVLASSKQATLEGRYAGSEYGKSKLGAERLLREHAERADSKAIIYRFPNIYGKWCRPNYNSAIATFCHNVAHDLALTINDADTELEVLYIDDLVTEMLEALLGNENYDETGFCHAGPVDHVTVGDIVEHLQDFKNANREICIPDQPQDSFSKKLYSTYLSYREPSDFAYRLEPHNDVRGSFFEVLRTSGHGQVSVNVSKPGVTKGNHWHHSKWEKFLVVSGEALIRERRIGTDASGNLHHVVEYRVSADNPEMVEMIPGYTHSITNLSEEHDLVTLMWANEPFDPNQSDTYYEEV